MDYSTALGTLSLDLEHGGTDSKRLECLSSAKQVVPGSARG